MTKKKTAMPADERAWRIEKLFEIVVRHPRLDDVHDRTIELISDTEIQMRINARRAEQGRGNEDPDHLWMLPIIGPSGATKSKTMQAVRHKINKAAPEGQIPIEIVVIKETTKSTKALYHQIFEALGDTNNMRNIERTSTPAARLIEKAIKATMEPRKTRILVVDEVHNLLIHAGAGRCLAMAQALKGLLNHSICSIIALGTEDARLLFAHDELVGRVCDVMELDAFRIEYREEYNYFFDFVETYEKRLVKDGVLDRAYGLASDEMMRATLFDAAGGIIGAVPRLMRIAVPIAFRDGRGILVRDDFQKAFEGLCKLQRQKRKNPFVKGPDARTLAVIREY